MMSESYIVDDVEYVHLGWDCFNNEAIVAEWPIGTGDTEKKEIIASILDSHRILACHVSESM